MVFVIISKIITWIDIKREKQAIYWKNPGRSGKADEQQNRAAQGQNRADRGANPGRRWESAGENQEQALSGSFWQL